MTYTKKIGKFIHGDPLVSSKGKTRRKRSGCDVSAGLFNSRAARRKAGQKRDDRCDFTKIARSLPANAILLARSQKQAIEFGV